MYRHEGQTAQSVLSLTNLRSSIEGQHGPKRLPSGSQLPPCWNEAMDRAICQMDAQNDVDIRHIPSRLKRSFPELGTYVIPVDALQRRIDSLDLQDNDYFKAGMEAAVKKAEEKGFVLPEYDPRNYPSKSQPMKSDLEIFGNGTPMTGILGFGASSASGSGDHPRRVNKITVGGRLRVPDKRPIPVESPPAVETPARQVSTRNEGLGLRRVQLAGEYSHPHNLTDITNTYNAPGLPVMSSNYNTQSVQPTASDRHGKSAVNAVPAVTSVNSQGVGHYSSQPATNSRHGKSTVNAVPPTTPVNSQGGEHFSTPSSRDKTRGTRGKGEVSSAHGTQYHSTPSSKDKNPGEREARKALDDQHQSAPSSKITSRSKTEAGNMSVAADSSSRDLYRSGRENTMSGMSTSTTGTSILGREISGMSAAIARRHAKIDHRITAAD